MIRFTIIALLAIPAFAQTTLEDFEKAAIENNPALGQAKAMIDAAAGREKQAGLYPNPTVSAIGEEISAGPIIRGGEFGGGFQQRIVTGGKLGLSRKVAGQDRAIAEEAAKLERQRVLTTVRWLYYQALGDQYRIEVRTRLAALASEAQKISGELVNVGQADRPDQLAAEVESARIRLELEDARDRQARTWRQLGAAINRPALAPVPLAGSLDDLPKLELDASLAAAEAENPEVRAANVAAARAGIVLDRAKRERIPDVIVGGGVRHNNELLEDGHPVGKEGFFDISVELPIFNRNQGNIAAARAEIEGANRAIDRTKLELRSRLAELYRQYRTALTRTDRYRQEMLPKAQQAYEMYLNTFRQMATAYPQVLMAQRNLFQIQDDYVDAMVAVWQSATEIRGLTGR